MSKPIQLDGSILEGGGQLLRVAVALSAVTRQPIQVDKIRLRREKPGLRHQHLAAVKAVAELVDADVAGLEVGSESITFKPRGSTEMNLHVDIGTAGSTTLVLQALMPALAFAPDRIGVTLSGGTNNPLAPSTDYMKHVLIPSLRLMGYNCQVELERRGLYPRGGGEVRIESRPASMLKPMQLTSPGTVSDIKIYSYSCQLPSHITLRMVSTASSTLHNSGFEVTKTEIEARQTEDPKCSLDPGCGILIVVEYDSGAFAGFDGLGEKGIPAEKVAEEVCSKALQHLYTQAQIERHLCDQLLIWMSLASGVSEIRTSELTLHSLTCMEIARKMLGVEFKVLGKLGESATIRCKGCALQNEGA